MYAAKRALKPVAQFGSAAAYRQVRSGAEGERLVYVLRFFFSFSIGPSRASKKQRRVGGGVGNNPHDMERRSDRGGGKGVSTVTWFRSIVASRRIWRPRMTSGVDGNTYHSLDYTRVVYFDPIPSSSFVSPLLFPSHRPSVVHRHRHRNLSRNVAREMGDVAVHA